MSVNYDTTTINGRLNAVVARLPPPAILSIFDAFNNILVSISLASPVGAVSGGSLMFTTPVSASAINTGTPTKATISGGSGLIISGLIVSSFNGDIIIGSSPIISGQTVTLTTAQIVGR